MKQALGCQSKMGHKQDIDFKIYIYIFH